MKKAAAISIVAIAVMMAALVGAQTGSGIEFGRGASSEGTTFTGRADEVKAAGGISTYCGNARISLPAANAVIDADGATYTSATNEMVFSGSVRLKLDSK